jgi:hypothetical protein
MAANRAWLAGQIPSRLRGGAPGAAAGVDGAPATFADLILAREQLLQHPADDHVISSYREARSGFERREGRILDLYWGKQRTGAAITSAPKRRPWPKQRHCPRMHRVSDQLTADSPVIAGTIQDWEILAVRARSLRGDNADVLMRWIFAATTYLIGVVAASPQHIVDPAREKEIRETQTKEIADATAYYGANASYRAYIAYFWGMMFGVVANAAIAVGCVWFVRRAVPWMWPHVGVPQAIQARAFGAVAAGAIGSLLSVMLRISAGNFAVNHDIGEGQLFIIGSFRPFIGAASGLALYLALGAGLLKGQVATVDFFVIAIAAFLAGFSERFARSAFLQTEQTIVPSASGTKASGKSSADGKAG